MSGFGAGLGKTDPTDRDRTARRNLLAAKRTFAEAKSALESAQKEADDACAAYDSFFNPTQGNR